MMITIINTAAQHDAPRSKIIATITRTTATIAYYPLNTQLLPTKHLRLVPS